MENEVEFMKYDSNRLMLIDWSSLSYHQLWSMNSEKNREQYGLQDAEGVLRIWKNKMVLYVTELIEKFNPRDIVFALDANSWRKQYVKDYYDENAIVYYDDKHIYTEADNFAYRVSKVGEGLFEAARIKTANYSEFRNLPHTNLGSLSPEKNKMLWDVFENGKRPIIPSYKGKRKVSEWPFTVDKKQWQQYKDEFGKNVAKFFRALAVQVSGAEGDDVLYTAVNELSDSYSSIIMVTRDSDLAQISNSKLHIYNHVEDTFVVCSNPSGYLTEKILRGDDSDNIQGMVVNDAKHPGLPKSTQMGPKTAAEIAANCPNIFEQAKLEGWDKQFVRNTHLIDLKYTPDEIKEGIKSMLAFDSAERDEVEGLGSLGITARLVQVCRNYRDRHFYAFQPRENVIAHPEMFNSEVEYQNRRIRMEEQNRAAEVQPCGENIRQFGDINIFDDPLMGIGNITDLI